MATLGQTESAKVEWSLTERRTGRLQLLFRDTVPGQYLCLDKNRAVRDPLRARSPLEICEGAGSPAA
jgi:hypothetical protein